MNGKVGNVVVAVKVVGKTRYNAHRVLMPDGTEFVLDNEKDIEPQSARVTNQKEGQRSAKGSMSNSTVTQNPPTVKNKYMQENEKNSSEEIFSIASQDYTDSMNELTEQFKSGDMMANIIFMILLKK